MKVIIAGSRGLTDYALVDKAVKASGFEITEVVCGEAHGADTLGRQWAESNNIPVKSMPANWSLGKSAGYRRNGEMAEYVSPDGGCICIWDGVSRGTQHMENIARDKKLKVFVLRFKIEDQPEYKARQEKFKDATIQIAGSKDEFEKYFGNFEE